MVENIRELVRYRALLFSLIARELKVRYRGSALGFLWTFINPLILMGIYTLVFSVYMRSEMKNYSYFMLAGLLPWLWFSTSVSTGASSISDRRDLISKVSFPPQILPMTVIGAALMNYLFSLPILLCFALSVGVDLGWPLVAFPLIVVVQLVLTTGIVYFLASANVLFRDLQHIVPNIISFAFFLTPIIYPLTQIPERYRHAATVGNPMAMLILSYQDIFYYNRWPSFVHLAAVTGLGVVLFTVSSLYMAYKREGFAEA
ncbi:MAG: ABC transporter permease [Deltaproteobacteria bacterium]|nr:ABC transporter permease [Deltaproteobacteria bacterium]